MPKPLPTAALALSALACATAAAAQRPSAVTGQVGLGYMRQDMETGPVNLDTDFISLEGALAFGLDHIGGAVDGSATQVQLTPGQEETAWAGTLHVNVRNDLGLIGAFGDERDSPRTARMLVFPADRQV